MPRYVAFLRGVGPGRPSMADLRACLDSAGFRNVHTVLGSGNVVFDFRGSETAIETRLEDAMQQSLKRVFLPFVRRQEYLSDILALDPFASCELPVGAKRVVTFLRDDDHRHVAGAAVNGATIVTVIGREAYSAYLPTEAGPIFMKLIESAFGKSQTTRTLETIRKCARH